VVVVCGANSCSILPQHAPAAAKSQGRQAAFHRVQKNVSDQVVALMVTENRNFYFGGASLRYISIYFNRLDMVWQ
jgi:hypothetical protein